MEDRALMSLNVFPVLSGTETSQIATGHDGNLYFTEPSADKIGRISPAGVVTEFAVPTPNALPGTITAGPDGNVYFTETGANRFGDQQIGRITPAGKISEFSLGGSVFEVGGIAAGPDGNVYASISTGQGEGVARITAAGTITDLQPTEGFTGINAGSITAGPDGNLWFTDPDNRQIVRTTPAGIFTAFALPANSVTGSQAGGITAGPDGNLWFTEQILADASGQAVNTGAIGEFNSSTHAITDFIVPGIDAALCEK
jgi:virginiamycin B lyase